MLGDTYSPIYKWIFNLGEGISSLLPALILFHNVACKLFEEKSKQTLSLLHNYLLKLCLLVLKGNSWACILVCYEAWVLKDLFITPSVSARISRTTTVCGRKSELVCIFSSLLFFSFLKGKFHCIVEHIYVFVTELSAFVQGQNLLSSPHWNFLFSTRNISWIQYTNFA